MEKIYLIVWRDAVSSGGGWDDQPDHVPDICYTVGVVVHENDDVLTIAQTWDSNLEEGSAINGWIQIPKGMIEEQLEIFDMEELNEVD